MQGALLIALFLMSSIVVNSMPVAGNQDHDITTSQSFAHLMNIDIYILEENLINKKRISARVQGRLAINSQDSTDEELREKIPDDVVNN